MGTILAVYDLQVTPILPTTFGVNKPFGLGEEVPNIFSNLRPRWFAWIAEGNDCSYFYLQVAQILPIKFRVNWFSVQEKKLKYIF